jgi:formiminoglutamase
MKKGFYTAPDQSLWQGRKDAKPNEYLFQQIECQSLSELNNKASTFALLGFCSDAGVKRNQGRPGAKEGPNVLKQTMASLPLQKEVSIIDAGNVECPDDELEQAQEQLGEAVFELLNNKCRPILLGGGHETAWGHYQGITKHIGDEDLAIINIDAHLDLRPLVNGKLGSSGTPFTQIAETRKKAGLNFNYYCFGIQTTANTKNLFHTAKELDVQYIPANDMHKNMQSSLELIDAILKKHKYIYLTICLDAFGSYLAPGVSAPQINGITLEQAATLIKPLIKSNKLLSSDIVEYAPCFDCDHKTAKLATHLISLFLA